MYQVTAWFRMYWNTELLLSQNMVKTYKADVGKLRPKVTELERDVRTLTLDVNKLKQEVRAEPLRLFE